MKYLWLLCGLCFGVTLAQARTLIVAADGTGDYPIIAQGVDSANAGDTVLVRDGDYFGYNGEGELFAVDSGVVVCAEHSGGANIACAPAPHCIDLHGSAKLIGFQIWANPMVHATTLVYIVGGPATLYNCQFHTAGSLGNQVVVNANGHPPTIQHCAFQLTGPLIILGNADSTNIWMPYNYYQTTDTATIHEQIWDGNRIPGNGYVYISPVLDSFQWLSAPEHAAAQPLAFSLSAYPNPFNPVAVLSFSLARQSRVTLQVFNVGGREIQTLADQPYAVGEHRIAFDGSALPSGVYFARLKAQGLQQTTKLVLMR